MPRKRRADIRDLLVKRLQEPETAKRIVDKLLTFPDNPDKIKPGDLLKLVDIATEGKAAAKDAPEAVADSGDLSRFSDAELRRMLRELEGGKESGP